MDKRIKKLWIAALRSGKYKQTTYKLRKDDRFCCLGVLCDIHSKDTSSKWNHKDEEWSYGKSAYAVLPSMVVKWAGLPDSNPYLTLESEDMEPQTASDLNDAGESFRVIATRIEKYL